MVSTCPVPPSLRSAPGPSDLRWSLMVLPSREDDLASDMTEPCGWGTIGLARGAMSDISLHLNPRKKKDKRYNNAQRGRQVGEGGPRTR